MLIACRCYVCWIYWHFLSQRKNYRHRHPQQLVRCVRHSRFRGLWRTRNTTSGYMPCLSLCLQVLRTQEPQGKSLVRWPRGQGILSVHCELPGKGQQALCKHLGSTHEPRNGLQHPGPATLPKPALCQQHSVDTIPFQAVCFTCSSLELVEKQLGNACKLICPPLVWSLQGLLKRLRLPAVQRKSVLGTHSILTPYRCQGPITA